MSDAERPSRSTAAAARHLAGEWVTVPVSYVDPQRRFCAYCGRPLGRRFWRSANGGVEQAYCSPDHASRDTTYPTSTDRE